MCPNLLNFYGFLFQDKFDYPNNQQLIYEYHGAFQNVHTIIKRNDGSLPKFWLSLLRDWLLGKCFPSFCFWHEFVHVLRRCWLLACLSGAGLFTPGLDRNLGISCSGAMICGPCFLCLVFFNHGRYCTDAI